MKRPRQTAIIGICLALLSGIAGTLRAQTATGQITGTVQARRYYEGPSDIRGDVRVHGRFFTYRTDAGLVSGCAFNVMFTIDRPAREAWPYVKDFNLWQNAYNHYYSGVVGDLEGKTFRLSVKPNDPGPHHYRVERVIPEYLIVFNQPVPTTEEETRSLKALGYPGVYAVSPGYHVFMLNEHGGKTDVTIFMEHATVMAPRNQKMTDEEALAPWRGEKKAPEWLRKWRDDFIPTLKKLVYEGRSE